MATTTTVIRLIIIILTLIFVSYAIKIPLKMKKEKLRTFECGFDPNHNMRNSFSLRFFLVTVIFLIFDAELRIIFPLPISATETSIKVFSK